MISEGCRTDVSSCRSDRVKTASLLLQQADEGYTHQRCQTATYWTTGKHRFNEVHHLPTYVESFCQRACQKSSTRDRTRRRIFICELFHLLFSDPILLKPTERGFGVWGAASSAAVTSAKNAHIRHMYVHHIFFSFLYRVYTRTYMVSCYVVVFTGTQVDGTWHMD